MHKCYIITLISMALLWQTHATRAADAGWTSVTKLGCTIEARAYRNGKQSQYNLWIPNQTGPHLWDFIPGWENDWSGYETAIDRLCAPAPYGESKTAAIPVTLYEYETYEESITFIGLPLDPAHPHWKSEKHFSEPGRRLAITNPITRTTASGITITILPKEPWPIVLGNGSCLEIWYKAAPNYRPLRLFGSPLYQKYRIPETIVFDCKPPYEMLTYNADNTSCVMGIGMPDLETETKIDKLTLIIRHRVNIRSVPVTIMTPIATSAPPWGDISPPKSVQSALLRRRADAPTGMPLP